jgi:uncharacterized protein YbjT (DUF2867 family)
MTRVLLTGGTGTLGRELTPRLLAAGYTVRVMSRRSPSPGENARVEWTRASLESGAGLSEAVKEANVVVHAASSPVKRGVDVAGTARLLDQARVASVEHFVYISIVGIDRIGFNYYRNKLAAERLIETSDVPWTILRATQFHDFIDRILGTLARWPLAFIPTNWQFQSISTGEVADQLVAAVQQGPSRGGRLPDIGGPEVLRFGDMAKNWLAAQEMRRPIIHLPLPGKLSAGFRQGLNTTPRNRVGKLTWSEWLQARYSRPALPDIVTQKHEPSTNF